MKNRIFHAFLLTVMVIVMLYGLGWLPEMEIMDVKTKPVDLLADIRLKPQDAEGASDGAESQVAVDPMDANGLRNYDLPIQGNLMPIEDYSWNKGSPDLYVGHGMGFFYDALDKVQTLGRPVRVAYFGDSFIEGDIITQDLRAMLQSRFGGSGVGFVDIASPTAGFRVSVRTTSKGWASYAVTDKSGFDACRQGINERYFVPRGNGQVTLEGNGAMKAMHQDTWEVTTLYFRAPGRAVVTGRLNDEADQAFTIGGSSEVQQVQLAGRAEKAFWSVPEGAGVFFGVGLESQQGITVDNFSMRGNSGMTLSKVPENTLMEFAAVRPYDLIVLQFGLNVANNKQSDYSGYEKEMENVIKKLAKAFPKTSILIVGVGDRGERKNGGIVTMGGIKALGRYQQQMAFKTGCAFWNLYQGMGGPGSIVKMADAKPAMANKDYTHINSKGGQFVAQRLFDALMHGYDERKGKNK